MRRRAFGVVLLAAAVLVGVGGMVVAARVLAQPDLGPLPVGDPQSGLGAQIRFAELLLRQGGLSRRTEPIVLTIPELNAFLARHLETRRLGLRPLLVRATEGRLEIVGRTSVRQVLPRSSLGALASVLPDGVLGLDLWLSAAGRVKIHDGVGELMVEQAALGRQAVPPAWLWRIAGVEPRDLLMWRAPKVIERIDIAPGRLLIHTRGRGG